MAAYICHANYKILGPNGCILGYLCTLTVILADIMRHLVLRNMQLLVWITIQNAWPVNDNFGFFTNLIFILTVVK